MVVAILLAYALLLDRNLWSWQFAAAHRPTEYDEADQALARTAASLLALNASAIDGAAASASRLRQADEQQASPEESEEDSPAMSDQPTQRPNPGTMRGILLAAGLLVMVEIDLSRDIYCTQGEGLAQFIAQSTTKDQKNTKLKELLNTVHMPAGAHGEKCKLSLKMTLLSTPKEFENLHEDLQGDWNKFQRDGTSYINSGQPEDTSGKIVIEGEWWSKIPAFKSKQVKLTGPWTVMEEGFKEIPGLAATRLPWTEVFVAFDGEGGTFHYCWQLNSNDKKVKKQKKKDKELTSWNDHCSSFRLNRLPAERDPDKLYHGIYFLKHAEYGLVVFTADIDLLQWEAKDDTITGAIEWRLQQVPSDLLQNVWEFVGDKGKSYVSLTKSSQEKGAYLGNTLRVSCNENVDDCPFLMKSDYALKFIKDKGFILLQERGNKATAHMKLQTGDEENFRTVLMLPIWKSVDTLKEMAKNLKQYDPAKRFKRHTSEEPACGGEPMLGLGEDETGGRSQATGLFLMKDGKPVPAVYAPDGALVEAETGPAGELSAPAGGFYGKPIFVGTNLENTSFQFGFDKTGQVEAEAPDGTKVMVNLPKDYPTGKNEPGHLLQITYQDGNLEGKWKAFSEKKDNAPPPFELKRTGKNGEYKWTQESANSDQQATLTRERDGWYSGKITAKGASGSADMRLRLVNDLLVSQVKNEGAPWSELTPPPPKFRNRLGKLAPTKMKKFKKESKKLKRKKKEAAMSQLQKNQEIKMKGNKKSGKKGTQPKEQEGPEDDDDDDDGNDADDEADDDDDEEGEEDDEDEVPKSKKTETKGTRAKKDDEDDEDDEESNDADEANEESGVEESAGNNGGRMLKVVGTYPLLSEPYEESQEPQVEDAKGFQPMLQATSCEKPNNAEELKNNQEVVLRTLNPGCWVFGTMGACVANADGRVGYDFYNSECAWCCGEPCMKEYDGNNPDLKGHKGLCMPRKVLETNNIKTFKSYDKGGDKDTCNGKYVAEFNKRGYGRAKEDPGVRIDMEVNQAILAMKQAKLKENGVFDVNITGKLPEENGNVKVRAPDDSWWLVKLPKSFGQGIVTIQTTPLNG
mmetsp:Transcript_18106/g.32291  ORF Transcript_18106/g.32291 Transcript_18106/m.32291 type:complete len:1084 (+) Transcript_18106:108-3359(+)